MHTAVLVALATDNSIAIGGGLSLSKWYAEAVQARIIIILTLD
jgi:hypothetical protein